MKTCTATALIFAYAFLVASCAPVFYSKENYPFYDKDFLLDKRALLRTDGFYVPEAGLDSGGEKLTQAGKYEVYKFYKTGQASFVLMDSLQGNDKYFDAMQRQIDKYGNGKREYTLFQGYYRVRNDQIVIQQVNVTTGNFIYLYGFVENNRLSIIKRTIDGDGKFLEDSFSNPYRMTYIFSPYARAEEGLTPNW
ncbi:hypothetical protein [Denitromonas iodatirespirans]|uniref:Uncharacterized protein n=1 Tax=Denitromonas iodatirespirans TaxID=2795389 RepID=A0A944DFF5_DENI1|nr:hypothetical protein [Denitromonas iodatirespirans]MBT0964101.1 hypothetical protein [Denitromonas iodatirespirans]